LLYTVDTAGCVARASTVGRLEVSYFLPTYCGGTSIRYQYHTNQHRIYTDE